MFNVNGNPILQSEIEVLEELRRQLLITDVELFSVFRPSGHNIMTTCPFHKGGKERKPSFGISMKDMACHCFTCGWTGPLDKMISNVFGHDDDGAQGRQWLAKNFLTISIEQRKPIEFNVTRGANQVVNTTPYITEKELDSYRYTHEYMYERGLTDELIEEFDIGFDKDTNCITFPVTDINSNTIFIARRSVISKFFHYPEGAEKPVYGANRLVTGKYKQVIICESILNALTCWKYGKAAVALIGTGTAEQYKTLIELPVRKYIIATDPDEAGQRAALKLRKALAGHKVVTQYDIPVGQDINDLDEKFLNLVEYF